MREDRSRAGTKIFIQANYLPYRNTYLTDNISVLTNLLLSKFPKVTVQSLMIHVNLKYEDIRVVNNGA